MPKQKKNQKKSEEKPCEIKSHFTCDGYGQVCDRCGESEGSCSCDGELVTCDGCDGTGRICVEHDSPCGDLTTPPRCDASKKAHEKS